jgi:hypothetical protein
MIREEQIALRQCAHDAFLLFQNFNKVFNKELNLTFVKDQIEIIPALRDLKFDESQLEKRIDWAYDEATAAQILYLYGAIKHKFDGNADLFFKLYGKSPFASNENERNLTIGSLDIGAGTTDLMICNYNYNHHESTTISPQPVYSESFDLAGDELLKNIIQEIILEGKQVATKYENCSGVILNHGKALQIPDMTSKINGFFGRNSAKIDYKAKMMRVSFINQIGIPIALKYLSVANEKITFSQR